MEVAIHILPYALCVCVILSPVEILKVAMVSDRQRQVYRIIVTNKSIK